MKKCIIYILIISLIIASTTAYASSDISQNIDEATINFYDDNLNVIDTVNYRDYIDGSYQFPVFAQYMDFTVTAQKYSAHVDIYVNDSKYGETQFFDISRWENYNVKILITDVDANEEFKYTGQLIRNSQPRDCSIDSIHLVLSDANGDKFYPNAVDLADGANIIQIPSTITSVAIEGIYTADENTIVKMAYEDGNTVYYGVDNIKVNINGQAASIMMISTIDNSYKSYAITFQKASSPLTDNGIDWVSVLFSNSEAIYGEVTVDIEDDVFDYYKVLPETTTFCSLFASRTNYMSTAVFDINAESGLKEWQTDFDAVGINEVYIHIVAESGDMQTYHITLNVKDGQYDVNLDYDIDMLDLVATAQNYGIDAIDTDFNDDGIVNLFDLILISLRLI